MLNEIVEDFIEKGNTILTSSTGNGCTVLTVHLSNIIAKNDKIIIYYNPTGDIDKNFIRKYYPRVYKNVLFITGSIKYLLNFLLNNNIADYLIIDPGDVFLYDRRILGNLNKVLTNTRLVVTSQIRQDPNKGGKIYSSIERSNDYLSIFKYSIWIRNTSSNDDLFKLRYADVYDKNRNGNKYIRRYLLKFSKDTGVILL